MKYKNILLILILLLYNKNTQAQSPHFNWVKQISSDIHINSFTTDAGGNVYSTGSFDGSPDFDPNAGVNTLTDNGFGDIFIFKTDPLGNLLWVKQIGGASYDEGKSVSIDANGNIYVAGFFSLDSIDFDPGLNTHLLSAGGENSFVLKLDNNGNFVWVKQIESLSENFARSISLDHQNNILVTGRFEGTADFDPGAGTNQLSALANAIYIWKLDNNGNFIWAKEIETVSTRSIAIATDAVNNIFVTGMLVETTDFDPSSAVFNLTTASSSGNSPFMLKLNAMGNLVWAKKIDDVDMIKNDRNFLVDSAGNSYYAGTIMGTADLDPNVGTHDLTATTGNNHFLLQLNSNGDFVWVNQLAEVKGLALDKHNNVFTCGSSIKKFNASGINQWTSANNLSTAISISPSENVYTTGQFTSIFDFDPDSTVYNLTPDNNIGTFILKLSTDIVSGVKEPIALYNDIRIYPNPNNGTFFINASTNGEYKVYNNLGSNIKTIRLIKNEPYKFDAFLPNGLYFIQNTNRENRPSKILIMR